ncbi:conserved phage C-terminal domain-containing protein [Filibacter tadaridae]
MMNLLIEESPLQVLPSLVKQVGLNEAIVLQQLHFISLISTNVRDGHKWVYKTVDEWKNEEFPFWSVDTIKRAIRRLEDSGYIISTASFNRTKMDKTKCYRINYEMLHCSVMQDAPSTTAQSAQEEVQDAPSTTAKLAQEEVQIAPSTEGKMPLAITKEVKSIKKDIVENDLDVVSVIEYLNDKASTQFKASSKATARLVKGRLREGYKLTDFKKVIDTKARNWLGDPHWQKYLRPSTLFNATNFENYLEESRVSDLPASSPPKPLELDFSEGET